MDWTTTSAALVAAGTSAANLVWTGVDRWATQKHRRRENAAGAVGRLLALLAAANPETGIIGGIPKEKALEIMFGYWERWDSIQIELEALRVSHPSEDVARKTKETIDAVVATLTRTNWGIHEDRPFSSEQWDDLKGKYATAKDAAESLREAIRSS